MSVFVVVAIREPAEVEQKLQEAVKEEHIFQVKSDVWLVNYDGISRQLAEKLFLEKPMGSVILRSGIVFPITNYFGLAPPDIWEWLGTHMSGREG